MRVVAAILVLVLVIALQTAVLPDLRVLDVRPNLLLVLLMSWAIVRGTDEGRVVVLTAALLVGMLSGDPAGFPLIALAPIVPLAALLSSGIVSSRAASALLATAVATLLYESAYTLLLAVSAGAPDFTATLLHTYPRAVVVNLLLTPVVYWAILTFSGDLRLRRQPAATRASLGGS